MSSWKKAAKSNQKVHRERAQPSAREHLGLLEKKQDYKRRAKDQHEKDATLRLLRKRALNRNPDEFYHHMINSRVEQGVHRELDKTDAADEHSPAQIRLMETQDLKYINMKRTMEANKVRRLQAKLHMTEVADKTPNRHIFFVDDEREARNFDVAERLGTHPSLIGRKTNRLRLEQLEKIELGVDDDQTIKAMNEERQKAYTELNKRIEREKELTVIQQKMEIKRALKEKRSRKPKKLRKGTKDEAPVYKFKYERKR
ncbi:probable U3 small nucleolar RNA-associated protein 11 [Uranotaenia lowii]|uniref:probable U3 small nucleolar RNA-associated protein 11 n=1 Tax=Uranotaenia lowii TaxID=190385 RepID=UPI00247A4218|nr:probable U3 small nucleolar RNA-associated protein 11 [Uranotaenia lowii]XP_055587153.1 probable U3 small nucleolar RNA-associated protein 11 [Uranotaenia lowii]